MKINGKKIDVKMDLGVARLFKEKCGRDFLSTGTDDFADTDVIMALLYAIAKRSNAEITEDDIDAVTFTELPQISQELEKAFADFLPESDGGAPLKKNP